MSRGYALTPEAERNIDEILVYVEVTFGARTADRVYQDLLSASRLLGERPRLGRERPDL